MQIYTEKKLVVGTDVSLTHAHSSTGRAAIALLVGEEKAKKVSYFPNKIQLTKIVSLKINNRGFITQCSHDLFSLRIT